MVFFPLTSVPLMEILLQDTIIIFTTFIGFEMSLPATMVYLGRCRSSDMGSTNEVEDTECSILTMDPMVSLVLTTAPTDTHDSTNNLLHCIDPGLVNPDMYYLPKNSYSDYSCHWDINYHKH